LSRLQKTGTNSELKFPSNDDNLTLAKQIYLKNYIRCGRGAGVAKRNDVKNDLLDQLERNEVYGNHYIDLIDDYMAMWDVKNSLIKDIHEKGVSVKYQNGENQWGYKKNDSVRELTNVNNQMLKLLDSLGLKASKLEVEDDDEEM
jgi:hypothetical protein